MTNNEINLMIAKIKKVDFIYDASGLLLVADNATDYYNVLDYINDTALNRELELSLLNNKWFCGRNTAGKYVWEKANARPDSEKIIVSDNDFGKAICLAWIEEFNKGEEK